MKIRILGVITIAAFLAFSCGSEEEGKKDDATKKSTTDKNVVAEGDEGNGMNNDGEMGTADTSGMATDPMTDNGETANDPGNNDLPDFGAGDGNIESGGDGSKGDGVAENGNGVGNGNGTGNGDGTGPGNGKGKGNGTTTTNPVKEDTKVAAVAKTKPSHADFDRMLKKYVTSSGKVNYSGFKSEKAKLNAYLKELETYVPKPDWSKNEKLAYWINVYNANTISLILSNYPVGSITDINGGKPWDKRFVKAGGKTYTLNEVENSVIRPKFKEPRIHFAVNCAAKSCPKLLNAAFMPDKLNSQLTKAAKYFVNNTAKNTLSAKKAEISKIFEWYAEDFGDIITFLNKYSNTQISSGAKTSYLEYDWALNK